MADAFIQVAPDSTGKKIDMELISTLADGTIYRQRAVMVGPAADMLFDIAESARAQLAVSRAILSTLNAETNGGATEEDFSQP